MSIDRWMDKEDVVHIYYTMEYYSAMKKNEIVPFAATWIQLEIIVLSEVSRKEKDKYHMISLICEIENMTQMNLSMKQKWIHRHREQTCVCQGWGRAGEEWIGSLGLADASYYIYRMDKQQGPTV